MLCMRIRHPGLVGVVVKARIASIGHCYSHGCMLSQFVLRLSSVVLVRLATPPCEGRQRL
jgi:hypothetical protein